MTSRIQTWGRAIRNDLPASIVVFLVAVPLSLGIALASGAPMMSGLIAAAVGGIVVGVLSGAPLLVSGPAAGLTVMVFDLIQNWGFATTCTITVLAGLLQAGFGRLRVARVALAISPAVVHGMLAGIGILIALAQLHVVLGGSPQSDALANLRELPAQILDLHGPATVLGLATIAILVVWQVTPLRRLTWLPGPLAAVVGVTAIASAFGFDVPRIALEGGIEDAVRLPTLPDGQWWSFGMAALALMAIASAESLLSAVATDKLHREKRADLDRELFAQGIGNMTSGLLGGLPVTGVIVRSTANVSSGAKTRASAILHGAWIVVGIVALEPLLRLIPLAVLAGLLVFVGVRLVNVNHIRRLSAHGEGWVYLATVAGVVVFGLLQGIAIGIIIAVVRLLWRFTHVQVRVDTRADPVRVEVDGPLTFVGVPRVAATLSALPPGRDVQVHVHSELLDHAGFEAIEAFREGYEMTGGKVSLTNGSTSTGAPIDTPPDSRAA